MTARLSQLLFLASCAAAFAGGGLLGAAWRKQPDATQPREAVAVLRELTEAPPAQPVATTPFARALAAIEHALGSPAALTQAWPPSSSAAAALAPSMAERDPARFLAWLERDAKSERPRLTEATRLFFAAWLARDFDGAVRGARSLPKGASRQTGLELALDLLCARDASEVADFLRTNANDLSMTASLRQWVKTRPREAADFSGTLPAGSLRMRVYSEAVSEWADHDPPAVLNWATEQKGMFSSMAHGPAFQTWASKDPTGFAAAWPQLPSAQRHASAGHVAEGLAAHDPQSALTWTMANTNGFLRYGTLRSVFETWSRTDLAAAAAAALTLPGGTSQQAAAKMLTTVLVKSDPAAARAWAAQLAPGAGRESALQRLPNEPGK